jgi:hypothetical protein
MADAKIGADDVVIGIGGEWHDSLHGRRLAGVQRLGCGDDRCRQQPGRSVV